MHSLLNRPLEEALSGTGSVARIAMICQVAVHSLQQQSGWEAVLVVVTPLAVVTSYWSIRSADVSIITFQSAVQLKSAVECILFIECYQNA